MTAGAVARHQAQEAAVHAWDAQKTIGKPEPIPASVAVDAVAEFLEVTLGSQGPWPPGPDRVLRDRGSILDGRCDAQRFPSRSAGER